MNVELASARRRIAFRHVLLDDLVRLGALNEHRSEISNQRRQNVALGSVESICTPDCIGFLAERAEKSADNFGLPIQIDEPLLERARQSHIVVELEQLFSREVRVRT